MKISEIEYAHKLQWNNSKPKTVKDIKNPKASAAKTVKSINNEGVLKDIGSAVAGWFGAAGTSKNLKAGSIKDNLNKELKKMLNGGEITAQAVAQAVQNLYPGYQQGYGKLNLPAGPITDQQVQQTFTTVATNVANELARAKQQQKQQQQQPQKQTQQQPVRQSDTFTVDDVVRNFNNIKDNDLVYLRDNLAKYMEKYGIK